MSAQMAWQPRHSDIADAHARHLAAWFFVTMRRWSGTTLAEVSTVDAESHCPREWLATVSADAPLTVGASVPAGSRPGHQVKAGRALIRSLPELPPPTWQRGRDGRLYPVSRRTVADLAGRLTEVLPDASDRSLARLIGCSHETVATHRRPGAW